MADSDNNFLEGLFDNGDPTKETPTHSREVSPQEQKQSWDDIDIADDNMALNKVYGLGNGLPIYSNRKAFFDRHKDAKVTIIDEKNTTVDDKGRVHKKYKSVPFLKRGANPLIKTDYEDYQFQEGVVKKHPITGEDITVCIGQECTGRAAIATDVLAQRSAYYDLSDKTKKDMDAEYFANLTIDEFTYRDPTPEELEKYPYSRGDTKYISMDAWDIVRQMRKTNPGAVVFDALGGRDYVSEDEYRSLDMLDYNNFMQRYKNKLAVGAYINVGNPTGGRNSTMGGSHTLRVIGWDDEKKDFLVFDYGDVKNLKEAMYVKGGNRAFWGAANIPGKEHLTIPYFRKKQELMNTPSKEKYIKGLNKVPVIGDDGEIEYIKPSKSYKKFHKVLGTNKNYIVGGLGMDPDDYDRYAKIALTLGLGETKGHNLFSQLTDMVPGSESVGPAQLVEDNVAHKYKQTLSKYKKSSNEYNALATLLYISELDNYKDNWVELGRESQERPYKRKNMEDTHKRIARKIQGSKNYGYFKSDSGRDFFRHDEFETKLPYKKPWQSREEYTKSVNEVLPEKFRFAYDDNGDRTIYSTTEGNQEFSETLKNLEDFVYYAWQSPNTVRYGDAQGESGYYRNMWKIHDDLFGEDSRRKRVRENQAEKKKADRLERKKHMVPRGKKRKNFAFGGIKNPETALEEYSIMQAKADLEGSSSTGLDILNVISGLATQTGQGMMSKGLSGGGDLKGANKFLSENMGLFNALFGATQGAAFLETGGFGADDVFAEGGEIMETPGGQPMELEGPSHAEGGIPLTDVPDGTKFYSDQVKGPDGKTMAERKKEREDKEAKAKKAMDANPTDFALQETYKKIVEDNEKKEALDMMLMEMARAQSEQAGAGMGEDDSIMPEGDPMMNMESMMGAEEFATGGTKGNPLFPNLMFDDGMEDPFGLNNLPSKRPLDYYTGNKLYSGLTFDDGSVRSTLNAIGDITGYNVNLDDENSVRQFASNIGIKDSDGKFGEDHFKEAKNFLINNPSNKITGGFKDSLGSLLYGTDKEGKPGDTLLNNQMKQMFGYLGATGDETEDSLLGKSEEKEKSGLLGKANDLFGNTTIGDMTGIVGTIMGITNPKRNTLANRAGDTPYKNHYKGITEEMVAGIDKQRQELKQIAEAQKAAIKRSANSAKKMGRNSSRSINISRAIDLAREQQAGAREDSVTAELMKSMLGLSEAETQAVARGRGMEAQAETMADEGNRRQRDNYYTQMAQNIANEAMGVQRIGQVLNEGKQRDVTGSLYNQLYDNYNIDQYTGELKGIAKATIRNHPSEMNSVPSHLKNKFMLNVVHRRWEIKDGGFFDKATGKQVDISTGELIED